MDLAKKLTQPSLANAPNDARCRISSADLPRLDQANVGSLPCSVVTWASGTINFLKFGEGPQDRHKPGVFFKGNICGFRVPNFLPELRILSWFSLVMKKSTMYSMCRWLKHRTWKVLRLPGLWAPWAPWAGACWCYDSSIAHGVWWSLPKHIVSLCKFSIAHCKLPECNLKGKHCMIQCASLSSSLWTVSKTTFVR